MGRMEILKKLRSDPRFDAVMQLDLFGVFDIEPPARPKAKPRSTGRPASSEQRILQFDLFGDVIPTEPVGPIAIDKGTSEVIDLGVSEMVQPEEEKITWTAEEVVRLHSVLLEETLRMLTYPSAAAKTEALEWIFSDYQGPFSFQCCCWLEGMDFEAIWEQIDLIIRRHMQATH